MGRTLRPSPHTNASRRARARKRTQRTLSTTKTKKMKTLLKLLGIILIIVRLFFWLVQLPACFGSLLVVSHIISLIAFIVAFSLIFTGDDGEERKHRGLIILLSVVSLILYEIMIKLGGSYYINETLFLDESSGTNARQNYQYTFFVVSVVNSVVGVWLAAILDNIFKNSWAALVAYIFPPIAIIAALLPRRNVED